MPLKIAYVVMKFPTLSQTFIEREMRALASQGTTVEVHPCLDFRAAEQIEPPPSPGLTVVRAGSPGKVLWSMALGAARELGRRPGLIVRGLRLLARHRPRHWEGWFHTVWGTLFALARAQEFRRRAPDVIHGAWATAPATVAAVLGELCGTPYSFGAHAYDLHRDGGDPLLPAKMESARFVHTTTRANVEDLGRRFPGRRAEIVLSRRGLPEWPLAVERTDGTADNNDGEVKLLSVGRLVPKKGQHYQIAACRELARRNVRFRLRIIGEGPLRGELAAAIRAAGLEEWIELAGEQDPAEVRGAYAWADVFWHTGVVDAQGDRDGLPNVIPEAFSHGLPVVSSAAGGAGEAVADGVTGLIVNPADTDKLADAIERLAREPKLRRELGARGREWAEANFSSVTNGRILQDAFARAAGGGT